MSDIAVIGAGLIGLASALELARDGHAVTVFDRAPEADKCSWGNAGGIAVTEVAPAAMPGVLWRIPGWLLHPLGPVTVRLLHAPLMMPWFARFAASAQRSERIATAMAPLLGEVNEDLRAMLAAIGLPHDLHPAGALTVYPTRAAFRADAAEWALKQRHGIECRTVSGDEARAMEPALGGRVTCGVFTPAWSHVSDPKRIWRALLQAVREQGVRVQVANIAGLGGPGEVVLQTGPVRFGQIVVAAGAWSQHLANSAGDRVSLESERGYHLTIPEPGVTVSREIIFADRKFVATPLAGGLRLAGTAEFAGLSPAPNYRRATMLSGLARAYLPGLNGAGQEWMGQRPATPDSMPVIGRSPRRPDLVYAFGHGHLGLTLSATTGRLVAGLVAGRPAPLNLAPFSIGRF